MYMFLKGNQYKKELPGFDRLLFAVIWWKISFKFRCENCRYMKMFKQIIFSTEVTSSSPLNLQKEKLITEGVMFVINGFSSVKIRVD